jgi:hypothetical protein
MSDSVRGAVQDVFDDAGATVAATAPPLPDNPGLSLDRFSRGHHPNVDRYAELVDLFWGEIGYRNEVDYALAVMWGESGGNKGAVGPPTTDASGRPAKAYGLFQHLDTYWDSRLPQARRFWAARGIAIGTSMTDPVTNIAVAAWLREVGGWGHWSVAQKWYKPGSFGPDTRWNGYEYENLLISPDSPPPRGDGQIAGGQTPSGSSGFFTNPVPGAAAPGEGGVWGAKRDGGARLHEGWDLGGTEGTPILAMAAGKVIFAGYRNDSAGYSVIVDHGGGWQTKYFHIEAGSFVVDVGETVAQGQHLAGMGDTGNPAPGAYHLHFQIERDGKPLDPAQFNVLEHDPGSAPPIEGFGALAADDRTPRQKARDLSQMTLDTMSQAVAGGPRLTLAEARELPDPTEVSAAPTPIGGKEAI